MIDLHAEFCAESCFKLSYSCFTKLRPSYCVAPKVRQRDTYACYHHENFSLFTAALHRIQVIKENTTEKMVSCVTCDKKVKSASIEHVKIAKISKYYLII